MQMKGQNECIGRGRRKMSDLRKILITKYDAIVAVKKYLDDEYRILGKEPNEKHNRWRAEAILVDVPSIDAPEDWGRYSDRLWRDLKDPFSEPYFDSETWGE